MAQRWSAAERILGLVDTVPGLLDTALDLLAKVGAGRLVGESAHLVEALDNLVAVAVEDPACLGLDVAPNAHVPCPR
jgi:hypothetical protein